MDLWRRIYGCFDECCQGGQQILAHQSMIYYFGTSIVYGGHWKVNKIILGSRESRDGTDHLLTRQSGRSVDNRLQGINRGTRQIFSTYIRGYV